MKHDDRALPGLGQAMDGYPPEPVRQWDPSPEPLPGAPVSQPPRPPAVDEGVLATLISELGDVGPEVQAALLDAYVQSGAAVADLATAARAGDAGTVRVLAHTLRSSSAWLGALSLAELLGEAETAARDGATTLAPIAERIEAEHQRVLPALTRLLGPTDPNSSRAADSAGRGRSAASG